MIAQVHVKTTDDLTSILVGNTEGTIYYYDVIDIPELAGIQKGVSYVKHQLQTGKVEIYPDKLDNDIIMKDAYINYCKLNHCIGENPHPELVKRCNMTLATYIRWNMRGGRE